MPLKTSPVVRNEGKQNPGAIQIANRIVDHCSAYQNDPTTYLRMMMACCLPHAGADPAEITRVLAFVRDNPDSIRVYDWPTVSDDLQQLVCDEAMLDRFAERLADCDHDMGMATAEAQADVWRMLPRVLELARGSVPSRRWDDEVIRDEAMIAEGEAIVGDWLKELNHSTGKPENDIKALCRPLREIEERLRRFLLDGPATNVKTLFRLARAGLKRLPQRKSAAAQRKRATAEKDAAFARLSGRRIGSDQQTGASIVEDANNVNEGPTTDRFKDRLTAVLKDWNPKTAAELSMEIHEAEAEGYEVSQDEDRLWQNLTKWLAGD